MCTNFANWNRYMWQDIFTSKVCCKLASIIIKSSTQLCCLCAPNVQTIFAIPLSAHLFHPSPLCLTVPTSCLQSCPRNSSPSHSENRGILAQSYCSVAYLIGIFFGIPSLFSSMLSFVCSFQRSTTVFLPRTAPAAPMPFKMFGSTALAEVSCPAINVYKLITLSQSF